MLHKLHRLFAVLILILFAAHGMAWAESPLRITVKDETLNHVDERLFGQFMEIASWGEPGPEAFVQRRSGQLPRSIVERIRKLNPPVIRFPGGTDVDYLNWTDRIDNVPGRSGGRPVSRGKDGDKISNAFGYDEFLQLTEGLESESLIVVNLGSTARGEWSIQKGARKAAALVAYCNAKPGESRTKNGVDWAAIRAKNGHKQPWNVK